MIQLLRLTAFICLCAACFGKPAEADNFMVGSRFGLHLYHNSDDCNPIRINAFSMTDEYIDDEFLLRSPPEGKRSTQGIWELFYWPLDSAQRRCNRSSSRINVDYHVAGQLTHRFQVELGRRGEDSFVIGGPNGLTLVSESPDHEIVRLYGEIVSNSLDASSYPELDETLLEELIVFLEQFKDRDGSYEQFLYADALVSRALSPNQASNPFSSSPCARGEDGSRTRGSAAVLDPVRQAADAGHPHASYLAANCILGGVESHSYQRQIELLSQEDRRQFYFYASKALIQRHEMAHRMLWGWATPGVQRTFIDTSKAFEELGISLSYANYVANTAGSVTFAEPEIASGLHDYFVNERCNSMTALMGAARDGNNAAVLGLLLGSTVSARNGWCVQESGLGQTLSLRTSQVESFSCSETDQPTKRCRITFRMACLFSSDIAPLPGTADDNLICNAIKALPISVQADLRLNEDGSVEVLRLLDGR